MRAGSDGVELWDERGMRRLSHLPWADVAGVDYGYLTIEGHLQPGIRDMWAELRREAEPDEAASRWEGGIDCSPGGDLDVFRRTQIFLSGAFIESSEPGEAGDCFRPHCIWLTCRWVPQPNAPHDLDPRHTLADGQLASGPWLRAINQAILGIIDDRSTPTASLNAGQHQSVAVSTGHPLVSEALRFQFKEDGTHQVGVGPASGEQASGINTAFLKLGKFSVVDAAATPPPPARRKEPKATDWDGFVAAMDKARSSAPAQPASSPTVVSPTAVLGTAGGTTAARRPARIPAWMRVGYPTKFQVGWTSAVALLTLFLAPFADNRRGEIWEAMNDSLDASLGIGIWLTGIMVFAALLLSAKRLGRSARSDQSDTLTALLIVPLAVPFLATAIGLGLGFGVALLMTLV
jgi:hypothetical protein